MSAIIEQLIAIANSLDKKGLYKEASELDEIITQANKLEKTAAMSPDEFRAQLEALGYGTIAAGHAGNNDIKAIIADVVRLVPGAEQNQALSDLVYKATGISVPLAQFKAYRQKTPSNEELLAKIKQKEDTGYAGQGMKKKRRERVRAWQNKYNNVMRGLVPDNKLLEPDGVWGGKNSFTHRAYLFVKKMGGWNSFVQKMQSIREKREEEKKNKLLDSLDGV
jgi:hypothetical protein